MRHPWACLAHMHTENIKETELPSRALPSVASQMHIVTEQQSQVHLNLLLLLQNTGPDNFPKILKALMKPISLKFVHLLPATCPEAKIQSKKREQARKWCQDTNSQVTFYMLQATSVMTPGCCTKLPASLLAWSTPFGVTRFIPWHLRRRPVWNLIWT